MPAQLPSFSFEWAFHPTSGLRLEREEWKIPLHESKRKEMIPILLLPQKNEGESLSLGGKDGEGGRENEGRVSFPIPSERCFWGRGMIPIPLPQKLGGRASSKGERWAGIQNSHGRKKGAKVPPSPFRKGVGGQPYSGVPRTPTSFSFFDDSVRLYCQNANARCLLHLRNTRRCKTEYVLIKSRPNEEGSSVSWPLPSFFCINSNLYPLNAHILRQKDSEGSGLLIKTGRQFSSFGLCRCYW